jgi:hypothetical protein
MTDFKFELEEPQKVVDSICDGEFGEITSRIVTTDGGFASEVEFRDSKNNVIGYWAYGSYDPSLPYKGD